jgi:hypothetical protein
MCFGNNTTTSTQTQTAPSWLQNAAQNNVNFAQNLQSTGFTPYTGQQVADFSPQQEASFGLGTGIAGAVTPGVQLAGTGLESYLQNAPNQPTVSATPISANMSPYMSQYVNMALQPQLAQAANTYMQQSQAQQGAATSAGAFGDPRASLLQSNLGLNYSLENQGLVGNAYNAAFNTAIGAGAQDTANQLTAQTTNAANRNVGLQEELAGVNTGFGQGTNATNLINTLGGQQTAQSQAQLNAMYNQYLMAQQYPFQTTQLLNSTMGAALPTNMTTTTTAPNNAGFGILGSLLGGAGSALGGFFQGQGTSALASALMLSDERVKTDKEKIGKTKDGLPLYRFRYAWDDPGTLRVGLMAQDVEKKYPDAVAEIDGVKLVDYRRATNLAAANDDNLSFGLAA